MQHSRSSHRLRPLGLALLVLVALAATGWSKVVYVNKNAPGTVHDGASWATAALTVSDGLATAGDGDELWLAGGTYVETVTVPGGVTVLGGFSGTEPNREQRNWLANTTALDANVTDDTQDIYVVTVRAQGVILDGLTIKRGADGVFVSGGSATIANCVFTGNHYHDIAVSTPSSAVSVSDCTLSVGAFVRDSGARLAISRSRVSGSGGVYVSGGEATIANCQISGPAGVVVFPGTATITDCTIASCVTGVRVEGTGTITNCTITGNITGLNLGPRISYTSGAVSVANCIVAHNGEGIHAYSLPGVSFPLSFSHNDVFGNRTGNYIGVADPTGTKGNISNDPIVSNIYHDAHIDPLSPCVGAGDPTVVQAGWTDIDGQPRTQFGMVDIGSDENDGTLWVTPTKTWYVSAAGNDANDGVSWGTAKKTIGEGLRSAKGPDEVWVATGTYADNVTIPPGVTLLGGFSGTESSRTQRNWVTRPTVLNARGSGVFVQGLAAALDGFSVRNGSTGALIYTGTATISNCQFSGNTDGIHVSSGPTTITNCVVAGNTRGVYLESSNPSTVANCTITGNSYTGLTANTSTDSIVNNIIAFNGGGSAFSVTKSSHNVIYGESTSPGPTDIPSDPLFVDRLAGNLRVQAGSPCINTGEDSVVFHGETDLDGKPRIIGPHVDIGAYEFGAEYYTMADAIQALRYFGGLVLAPTDVSHWNVMTSNPQVNLLDAIQIVRKANGLAPNP